MWGGAGGKVVDGCSVVELRVCMPGGRGWVMGDRMGREGKGVKSGVLEGDLKH